MRIETICTGDELLTGLTADTNSSFFQTLLLDASTSTLDAGLEAGFQSASAFVRAFRRRTGKPPAAWRRSRKGEKR